MAARKPLESLEAAYEAAVKMLARKARTTEEVRQELLGKGADPEHVESVLGRLASHRHLDDAVVASDEAFSLVEGKGLAPELAMHKLIERGISERLAWEAVQAVRENRSDLELCERALSRRLKGSELSAKAVVKEGRALVRLGYDEDVVTRSLERALGGNGE